MPPMEKNRDAVVLIQKPWNAFFVTKSAINLLVTPVPEPYGIAWVFFRSGKMKRLRRSSRDRTINQTA